VKEKNSTMSGRSRRWSIPVATPIAMGLAASLSHAAVTVTQDISPGHQVIPFEYDEDECVYRFSLTPAAEYLFVTGGQHVDAAPDGEDAIGNLSPAWSSVVLVNDQSLFESELTHLLPATTVFKPAFHGNLRPAPRGGGRGGGTMPIYPWTGVAEDDDRFHVEPYMAFVAVGGTQGSANATLDAVPASLAGIENTTWESNPSGLLTISPGTGGSVTVASTSATPAGLYEIKAKRNGGTPVDVAHMYGVEVDLDVPGLEEGPETAPSLSLMVGETFIAMLTVGPGDLPDGWITLAVTGDAQLALGTERTPMSSMAWRMADGTMPPLLELTPLSTGDGRLSLSYTSTSGGVFSDELVFDVVRLDLLAHEPVSETDATLIAVPEESEEEPGVWLQSGITALEVADPGVTEGVLELTYDGTAIALNEDDSGSIHIDCSATTFPVRYVVTVLGDPWVVTSTAATESTLTTGLTVSLMFGCLHDRTNLKPTRPIRVAFSMDDFAFVDERIDGTARLLGPPSSAAPVIFEVSNPTQASLAPTGVVSMSLSIVAPVAVEGRFGHQGRVVVWARHASDSTILGGHSVVIVPEVDIAAIGFQKEAMGKAWRAVDKEYKFLGVYTGQTVRFGIRTDPLKAQLNPRALSWGGKAQGNTRLTSVTFDAPAEFDTVTVKYVRNEKEVRIAVADKPSGPDRQTYALDNWSTTLLLLLKNVVSSDPKNSPPEPSVWAKDQYPGCQHNTLADAARHAYWTCLMTRYGDSGYALGLSTAHEVTSPGPSTETVMDLHNNRIGVSLADHAHNPVGDSEFQCCRDAVADAISEGKLWYLDGWYQKGPNSKEDRLLQPTDRGGQL